MRLFGRKSEEAGPPSEGIEEFWAWWSEIRPELDTLVDAGEADGLADRVGPAVEAIDPGLVWEIVPGRVAAQTLVVTAAGDPELRTLAHRWMRAAPAPDDRWEFQPSRQANPLAAELTFDIGGYDFDLDQLKLGLRVPPGKPRLDVTAYHPIFTLLDEEMRLEATLLALDWLLGEDEVARWVGEIAASAYPPIDAVAAAHLPSVVEDVASGYKDEQWALLEGETAGGAKLIATARFPLRPVDYPLFDQHIAISLPYEHADGDGLPDAGSVRALRDFEDRLAGTLDRLGGTAVLAAHFSAEGRRVLHVYADPASEAAAEIGKLVTGWREGTAEIEVVADPGWTTISPFLS